MKTLPPKAEVTKAYSLHNRNLTSANRPMTEVKTYRTRTDRHVLIPSRTKATQASHINEGSPSPLQPTSDLRPQLGATA